MAKKKVTKKTAVVKKKWYSIIAPKVFNEVKIGETTLTDPEKAVGRKMSLNLMSITGEPQKQGINVRLQIKNVSDNVFTTELLSYKIMQSAMKKMVRRNREKIDDSFVVKSKDDKILRIKPIAVTRGKTTNSVCTAIRKYVRAVLANKLSQMTYEEFVKEVLGKKVQQELYKSLKKFHPIAVFEIRAFGLLSEREQKNARVLKPVKVEEKKKEEPEQEAEE